MKETWKTVAPIYAVAAALILLTEAGYLKLPPTIERLLTEIGVALLAVGSIHILDHRTLIKETAERIERKSREMFDHALHGATEKMTGDVGQAITKVSSSIVTDVTTQTGRAFDEASQILQRQVESIKVMEESNLIAQLRGRPKLPKMVLDLAGRIHSTISPLTRPLWMLPSLPGWPARP